MHTWLVKRFSGIVWVFALCLGLSSCRPAWGGSAVPPEGGKVVAVFDGDTILLDSGERVRYLGIDAPETPHDGNPADCHGQEAREVNARMVLHRRVRIELEGEERDAHGRLLAYVIAPDGRCVNLEMLLSGHAWLYMTREGLSRRGEFLSAQREAIRHRRGMWGACSVSPAPFYLGNRSSFVMHRPDCPLGRSISSCGVLRFKTRLEGLEQGFRPCRRCKP